MPSISSPDDNYEIFEAHAKTTMSLQERMEATHMFLALAERAHAGEVIDFGEGEVLEGTPELAEHYLRLAEALMFTDDERQLLRGAATN